jgi:hypothetical protein
MSVERGSRVEEEVFGVASVHGYLEVRQRIERREGHPRALCARDLIGRTGDGGVGLGLRFRPLVQALQQRHGPTELVLPYEGVGQLQFREVVVWCEPDGPRQEGLGVLELVGEQGDIPRRAAA